MGTEGNHSEGAPGDRVTRFGEVIVDGGHAWVLAHDSENWFYECLKCGDWVHVLTIPEMSKAVQHGYAYMPVSHRAPWNRHRPVRVVQPDGEIVVSQDPPYPPCLQAARPVPAVRLESGPLVAVPRDPHDGSAGEERS